ncbi:hypothetical protein WHI96_09105 [Pseudonocardia tropica]|uniref:Secreted protein n=1 Tax=Pseudonocardia tropica TaxID=681289 RepID=A0ABV1JVR0_9PSEU
MRSTQQSTPIRRPVGAVAAALALTGALAAGLTLGPADSATRTVTAPVQTVAFCPFGTHDGPGSGCRGGGIDDNQRLNDALSDTGAMYVDAGECALKAVGKSLVRSWKRPSLPAIATGTIKPAVSCGHDKGY